MLGDIEPISAQEFMRQMKNIFKEERENQNSNIRRNIMICEVCKGKGWIPRQAPNIPTACPACGGKGFIKQTRFEYMQSCTIEEMAEVLSNISTCAWFAGLNDMDRPIGQKDNWQQWLKNPYTDKEQRNENTEIL